MTDADQVLWIIAWFVVTAFVCYYGVGFTIDACGYVRRFINAWRNDNHER